MRYLLIIISIFISSCTVLSKDIMLQLSSIEIGATDSIQGAEFYQRLRALLHSKASTKYLLNFHFDENQYDLAISKASDVMRKGIEQTISFQLVDKESDRVLLKDSFRLHSSYSLSIEPLTSYAQMDLNRKLLARRAAENLRYRLVGFFQQMEKGVVGK